MKFRAILTVNKLTSTAENQQTKLQFKSTFNCFSAHGCGSVIVGHKFTQADFREENILIRESVALLFDLYVHISHKDFLWPCH